MIYVLILLLFVDGEVVNGRLVGYATDLECRTAQVEMISKAKELAISIATKCTPVAKPFVPKRERDP